MKTTYKSIYTSTGYFFLLLFALVFFAFYKTYFTVFPANKSSIKSEGIIHFHALVSILWVILLVAQPLLIRYKKYSLHRAIGRFTYLLAPLIIGSFIALMYVKYHEVSMSTWKLNDIVYYFYFQILHTIFFITFYTLSIINRYKGNISLHSGYMIATGLIFINPITRRVFFNAAGTSFTVAETIALILTDISLIALMLLAKKNNTNYKLYYLILMMFMLYQVPMFALMYVFFPGG
ncbi:MAG: hypothetical protein K2Q21_08870 [Chitinophagaceae bacterium]|nr:hypothetical protein [Chitinophagaceae bacterium]